VHAALKNEQPSSTKPVQTQLALVTDDTSLWEIRYVGKGHGKNNGPPIRDVIQSRAENDGDLRRQITAKLRQIVETRTHFRLDSLKNRKTHLPGHNT
jgi:hypothetical protein